MGDLAQMSFLTSKRERQRHLCHRQIGRDRWSIASVAKSKRKSLHDRDDNNSQGCKEIRSGIYLPEDILRLIHAIMPLRDAARAACTSQIFLQSWGYHPNLIFTEEILGLKKNNIEKDDIKRDFINIIERILLNHSGIGVKTLKLELYPYNDVDLVCLDDWLHIAIAPGIEEITLMFPSDNNAEYNFPCSLLFERDGNSLRYLYLTYCAFRPTVGLGCLRSLSRLHLSFVRITGDELELLLSECVALEWLKLSYCSEIICLRVTCLLRRLGSLEVVECRGLRSMDIYAPNLSNFNFVGFLVRISFGNPLLVKKLRMMCLCQANIVSYVRKKLPSLVPNVETLTVASPSEIVSTPMVPDKFLHLKHLHVSFIALAFSSYDYLSLASFLYASPSLETFVLSVSQRRIEHDSLFGEPFHLRRTPEHNHEKLKSVKISGFCAEKTMVELTCYVIQNTSSLECLTLDTTGGANRCSVTEYDKCLSMDREILMEAHKAHLAIRTYVAGIVPPTVKLNVVEPCRRCHAVEF